MDIVYLQEDKKFITIPDGDVATHEQILEFFQQREIEQGYRKPKERSTAFQYFEF